MGNLVCNCNKKAQVIIILIIAIVIVGILITFFTFREKIIPSQNYKIQEVTEIGNLIEDCFKQEQLMQLI